MLKEGAPEFDKIKKIWLEEAQGMTIENLPAFLTKITQEYAHDYGTFCHAISTAAIAAAYAADHAPGGGLTGFQAGCVMWQFITDWSHSDNKTGMKLIDYDKFLHPQYQYHFEKTMPPATWEALQKEAKKEIEKADLAYAKFLIDKEQYYIDLKLFIKKYPDYLDNKAKYDHIGMGTADEHEAYQKKKDEGFEFAPREPWAPLSTHSPVYQHWLSIVAGIVPFGYVVKED